MCKTYITSTTCEAAECDWNHFPSLVKKATKCDDNEMFKTKIKDDRSSSTFSKNDMFNDHLATCMSTCLNFD